MLSRHLLVLLLATQVAQGGKSQPPTRTTTSENGAWTLTVEPVDAVVGHGAVHTLTERRSGGTSDVAWKHEQAFTLCDVRVTDNGWAYGSAYVRAPQLK